MTCSEVAVERCVQGQEVTNGIWNPGRHTHQVVPFMISSCSSTAHEMLLPNKQAHQQNKLSPYVRAIGENDSGKYKHKQVNKHSVTGLL